MYASNLYPIYHFADKLINMIEPIYIWIEKHCTYEVISKKRKQKYDIELCKL